ncbi:acetylglutamate kinase [Mycetocola spongiae]|uniref:acetylglutamate kinase n=1 Tax=Mycetocola spongiae TaxID=2859226 RepID=UPI001CF462D1|nr:acetylglutamate kinase [Mycetocola spongiae]UCR90239.1 acetylglutamate kinase [Mycetocola spongiae]
MPTTIEVSPSEAAAKAAVLIEALPWLKRYHGAIVVVKFGGNAMVSPELSAAFAEDMVFLHHAGLRPVVVHGGGPQISAGLAEKNIASEFRGGYRYTSPEAIGVVRDVLRNRVNKELVALINEHGTIARSIAGEHGNLFGGRTRGVIVDGVELDLGRVGDILEVDPSSVMDALDAGRIPVITSIAYDLDDPEKLLNINADSAAAAVAVALQAQKLLVLTDVAGLYSDWPNRDSLVSVINTVELRALLPELESGMIPKMNACLDAVEGGVPNAAIIDGRIEHSILLEVFTQNGIGTQVVSEDA